MSTPQLELINTEAHKDIKVNPRQYNTPENQTNACMVVASELSTLCHEYPIFITKHPEHEQFQLNAILGLVSGQNLFLDGDSWRAKFLPLDILRKPFQAFIPDPKEPSKGSIAIDMNSPAVNGDGEALFTESGESTVYFKRIEDTFAQLMGGLKYTSDLLKQANDLGLLEQVSLNFELANGEKAGINGLYSFNKENLTALKGADLETCHDSGILQISHLVLSSSIHLDKLVQWQAQQK